MARKEFLEKRLSKLQNKMNDLATRALASNDAAEVREINEKMEDLRDDMDEVKEELDALAESGEPAPANVQTRGGNPLAAFNVKSETRKDEIPFSGMEYRMAFKDLIQRGTPIPADVIIRAGGDKGMTTTADIGAIIPVTIMNEFIQQVTKVYGNIYAKVRKLNVQGGVKFPISKLNASFKWITETTVSDKQKAGDVKDFVTFNYNVGEIRVAQSLLSQVVSLPLFESEIVKIMVAAYVEAMDKGIISGTGSGQLLGITADPRVTNSVTFTAVEFADWAAWRKKLFAVVPLSKRGRGEFLFPASTVESYLLTMKDANDRPIFKEATDLTMGNTAGSFFGRTCDLVEPDVIKDFDTAATGDVVGVYWVPEDYAINTNLEFGVKRYFDDDTNEWINKGLTIVDGKILDSSGCYLIKKAASK